MALEDHLMDRFRHLSAKERQSLVDFADFLYARQESLPGQREEKKLNKSNPSAYDLAKEYVGIIQGPGDLSHNKAYFDDFGS